MDLDTERYGWTILSVRALRVPWEFVHTTAGVDTTAHTAKTCLSVAAPHVQQRQFIAAVGLHFSTLPCDAFVHLHYPYCSHSD